MFLVVFSLPSPWSSLDVPSCILLGHCYGFLGHPFVFLVVLFLTIVVVVVVLYVLGDCHGRLFVLLVVLFIAITLVLVVFFILLVTTFLSLLNLVVVLFSNSCN